MKVEISNTSVSFTRLADLLQDHIATFLLSDVVITGDENQLNDFWKVLRGHPNLTELVWTNVAFESPTEGADVDRLVTVALVSCPNLVRVVLNNVHKISVSSLKAIEYAPCLREVTLCHIANLSDQDATIIAGALSRNTHIEKVEFHDNGTVTEQGRVAFATTCLQANKSIQDVRLISSHGGSGDGHRHKSDRFRRQNSATAA
jgi:hypothetical protein